MTSPSRSFELDPELASQIVDGCKPGIADSEQRLSRDIRKSPPLSPIQILQLDGRITRAEVNSETLLPLLDETVTFEQSFPSKPDQD